MIRLTHEEEIDHLDNTENSPYWKIDFHLRSLGNAVEKDLYMLLL